MSDGSDGARTPTGELAGEDILFKGRGPAGGVASADDDEEVGWWAPSADNLLVLADTIQHEQRGAPNGDDNRGLTTTSSDRCSRNGVARKAPTTGAAAADGRSCDRVSSSDPAGKAPLAAELPPAPAARKSAGIGTGHPHPARGMSRLDVDAESGTVGVSTGGARPVAAVSGAGGLRVSWSSISARSSESDLEQESAPACSATSASNGSSGGSNSSRTGGCRRRRLRPGDDAPGTVLLPRSRSRPPPQRQQQVGSLYDRVSPSSYSSSSVSSRAFDGPNGGKAWTSRGGAGAGASRGAATVGLRHRRDGGTEAASGGARRLPNAGVAAAVPGSRRKLMQRAPIAGGGITTGTLDQTVTSAVVLNPGKSRTARPMTKPAAPSQRILSDSATSGRRRRTAAGLETPRENGGGGGGGGRDEFLPPSSSALRHGGGANVAPGTRRAAARVMPHHSNGGEEGRWRGPPETGRDSGLRVQGRPPDGDGGDVNEVDLLYEERETGWRVERRGLLVTKYMCGR